MAVDGSYFRNCPDIHLSRFLLLLCQECFRRTACFTPSLWSGVIADLHPHIFLLT
uniref:Uncharacterized protein n=1 Tax=Medicago truncatula TaxID=3880 RepID=I3SHX2_MEDTR|nr:unknown [Medicago truncatula]